MPDQRPPPARRPARHQVEAREVARRGLQARRARRGRTCRRGRARRRTRRAASPRSMRRASGRRAPSAIAAERRREQREEDVAAVPAAAVEAQDEGEQVERERHDPQQRHGGDVLRDVVGHREQQQRARRGERAPQHWRASVGGGASPPSRLRRRRAPRMDGRRARAGSTLASPRRAHSTDEERVARRPADRLRARRRPRLDSERIAEQRQQRREVGQREQAVRARAGKRSREPRLHQRAGGRQQEIRQADGGGEQPEDLPRRILAARGFQCASGNDRQQRRLTSEQREVQPTCARGCERRVRPVGSRRSRRAAASGRTPGRWSIPRPSRRTTAGSAWR